MTTFGSTSEDADGVPKNIDRGPPHEDRRTEAELRGVMRDIASAKQAMGKTATVEGISVEIQALKQQLEMTHEQMQRLIGMYSTLRGEFDQFKQQRAIELQSWLANGGSTTREDMED